MRREEQWDREPEIGPSLQATARPRTTVAPPIIHRGHGVMIPANLSALQAPCQRQNSSHESLNARATLAMYSGTWYAEATWPPHPFSEFYYCSFIHRYIHSFNIVIMFNIIICLLNIYYVPSTLLALVGKENSQRWGVMTRPGLSAVVITGHLVAQKRGSSLDSGHRVRSPWWDDPSASKLVPCRAHDLNLGLLPGWLVWS